MSVASVDHAFPPRVLSSITLGAGLVLAAALAGRFAPLTAVAVAVGGAAVVPAVALVWRGLAVHLAVRSVRTLRTACVCVGLFGLGVLVGGLTAAALPFAGDRHRPVLAAGGLLLAAALFMTGLLFIPGLARTPVARFRHGLDGVIIGILLALTGWLVTPQVGTAHPAGYLAAVVAAACASITAALLFRTRRQRPATSRCGTGVVLAIVGLALLVVTVGRDGPPWPLLVAAGLVLAGPPLIWAGVRRVEIAVPPAGPASPDETFGGYPVLAVPAAAALLAGAYHLVVVGLPDLVTWLLAFAAGAALTGRDILIAADLRRYARQMAAQQAHLRALVAGTSDVTMVLSEDLVVRWQSPAAATQLGLTDQDVVGSPLTDRIHPDDLAAFSDQLRLVTAADRTAAVAGPVLAEARLLDGAGRWRETESTISDLRSSPEVGALVVQVRDVGQRRHLERTLRRLTSIDQRTGLLNRRELLRAITARQRAGHPTGALIVIDLHGVAAVNDLRGRAAGDAVLVEVARRIRVQIGEEGVASRLGESQFAVVTPEEPIEAYALGVRLLAALTGHYQLADRPVQLQASAGLAGLSAGHSADHVLHRGSLALRQANLLGRNQLEWYDESLEQQLIRRLDLERHLPGAAGRGELDLVYQPVVELDGGRPVGVEALLRWRHPALGTVLPGELLPVAERLRLCGEIGEWVLHAACRQVAAWRRDGHDLWLAVNISACQLASGEFVPDVAAALSVHQTPPERLVVEISDVEIGERRPEPAAGAPAGDGGPADALPSVAAQLSKLRALGVRTALDDFGAGHTDLARLRRLPLDVVKLVTPSTVGPAGDLAKAVVDLTRRLGLTVIAEGLESRDQWELVRGAGCRYGQGMAVAPPAPPERVEAYLETQRTRSR